MAQEAQQVGINQGWSLHQFVQMKGKPKFATLSNKETGEEFNALMFPTKQGERDYTMVSFSSKIGKENHTKEYVAQHKEELRVVELSSGNYSLCLQGEGAWEDIDLW